MSRPFTTFNFLVEVTLAGESRPLCEAAFQACDGLEVSMEPTTYQQGGDNARQIHLVGPMSYGTLALKRGMTSSFDLWGWVDRVAAGEYGLRATTVVTALAADGATEAARFNLTGCLPTRLKAPGLDAQEGGVAIEELDVAYEQLRLDRPGGAGLGLSVGVGASVGGSVGVSASVGAGVSVSGGASVSLGFGT